MTDNEAKVLQTDHMLEQVQQDVDVESETLDKSMKINNESQLELNSEELNNCTYLSNVESSHQQNHYDKEKEEERDSELNLLKKKHSDEIQQFQEKCNKLEEIQRVLENKLELAVKRKESAVKEKEAMVIRYAVSEKNVLEQKQQKEQFEKKLKEAQKENEILLHKVQTMMSEKSRICQMLDNKTYDLKTAQQENERIKADLNALETKLKWSQNSLKVEIELHKESQAKVESLNSRVLEAVTQIQQTKSEAEQSIKEFHNSEENRAHTLDQQLKEQHASLILLKHERDAKDQQLKELNAQLGKLQSKQQDIVKENNELSMKVQQLERDRLESEQKLSELRACADQQRQDSANLQSKTTQLDKLKLQLQNEQEQLQAANEQIDLLKQRNSELESDMLGCREREAELLLFTQQLTDKNVRLQSEFTTLETKEQETRAGMLSTQVSEERLKYMEENETLKKNLDSKTILCEKLKQEIADEKGENLVMKRKFELSFKEMSKELQQCRKRLVESQENLNHTSSSSSSNSSLSTSDHSNNVLAPEQVKVLGPDQGLDRQTLIEHIVKLQRISARKSEKLDFLEEHVNTLVAELQKKTRLLQSYILRDQTGALTSNAMDNNKAHVAKLNGVMASLYSSRVADENLTLELSLDINRKLQAVLEDALLKNITLKENVDTLGKEIDRLNNLLKSSICS